jgi:hypothetical protein
MWVRGHVPCGEIRVTFTRRKRLEGRGGGRFWGKYAQFESVRQAARRGYGKLEEGDLGLIIEHSNETYQPRRTLRAGQVGHHHADTSHEKKNILLAD